MITSKYFNMGKVVVTHKMNETLKENNRFAAEVNLSLQWYAVKDWGNLDEEDKQTNGDTLNYLDEKSDKPGIYRDYRTFIITQAPKTGVCHILQEKF